MRENSLRVCTSVFFTSSIFWMLFPLILWVDFLCQGQRWLVVFQHVCTHMHSWLIASWWLSTMLFLFCLGCCVRHSRSHNLSILWVEGLQLGWVFLCQLKEFENHWFFQTRSCKVAAHGPDTAYCLEFWFALFFDFCFFCLASLNCQYLVIRSFHIRIWISGISWQTGRCGGAEPASRVAALLQLSSCCSFTPCRLPQPLNLAWFPLLYYRAGPPQHLGFWPIVFIPV